MPPPKPQPSSTPVLDTAIFSVQVGLVDDGVGRHLSIRQNAIGPKVDGVWSWNSGKVRKGVEREKARRKV